MCKTSALSISLATAPMGGCGSEGLVPPGSTADASTGAATSTISSSAASGSSEGGPGSEAASTGSSISSSTESTSGATSGTSGDEGGTVTPIDCGTVTCFYVREGAEGDNSGVDWHEAYAALPDQLERGAVYFIADGAYPTYTFDEPNVDDQWITVRKATTSDHGTESGWDDADGDGQAVFAGWFLITDYLVVDGATRNEGDWADGAAYGFRNTGEFHSNTANFGSCSSHVEIRHVDVGGPYGGDFDESMPSAAFYFGGFDELCTDWKISRVFAHNVGIVGQMAGVDNITWEYSWLGLNWSKEILRSQIQGSNITIHHNVFKDGCRDDHAPGTGCTAEIGIFGTFGSDEDYSHARIFGNVIWKGIGQHNSDASILVQNAHDSVAYNNTIVNDASSGQGGILLQGTNSSVRNNIWVLPNGMNAACDGTVCENNTIYTDSAPPFVDVEAGDFHLAAPLQGADLAAPFDVDLDGKTRGEDGIWDQGAFEFP
jgi:hypothetical protein